MKLAVAILNWNSADDTVSCVRNVSTWRNLHPHIWVVDNGSQDGSAAGIAEHCPAARLIRSETNRGFGGGNNLAIAAARREGADAILLLNNDASIREDDVATLLAVLEKRPAAGIVGPFIRQRDGDRTYYSLGGRNIVGDYDTHIVSDRLPDVHPPFIAVDYVPGTAALVRSAMLDSVEPFDENYFFSGEMADLCERARVKGWEALVVPSAIADHRDAAGALRDSLYAYYSIRNRFLFVRKHASRWYLLLWSARCVRIVFRHLRRGQLNAARCYWLAFLDGITGRFGNQHARVQHG